MESRLSYPSSQVYVMPDPPSLIRTTMLLMAQRQRDH
jgi:hypothetical protein